MLHLIDAQTFETEQTVRIPDPTIDGPFNSNEVDDDGVVVVPRVASSVEEEDVSISQARWQETPTEESLRAGDTLDLTGVCFDPTGSHVYVGSLKGIVEYRIKGAEKT